MPQAYVKKLANKHNISVATAEKKWEQAKKSAKKQGHAEDYDYITGIFKKMMHESLERGLKHYLVLSENIDIDFDDFESEDDDFKDEDDYEDIEDEDDYEDIEDEDIEDEDIEDEDEYNDEEYGEEDHILADVIPPEEDEFSKFESAGWSPLMTSLLEKWAEEADVPERKKGMFKGKALADLRSELSKLKKSGPHKKGSPEYTKEKELIFAIRAKSGWGEV